MKKWRILFFLLVSTGLLKAQVKALDIELDDFEYPFPVAYLLLKEQGQDLRMAYMDLEPVKPNGKAVLLLHGKNFAAAYWDSTALALSEKGFRVIMPDQIGFGKSSKPEHFQYSFHLLARNTKILLDSLKLQKVTVLGHSMGGMLATRFALMYPQYTEKLVLENPIGLEDYKVLAPYQSIDELYATELKQDEEKIRAYQLQNYYGGQWKPAYDKWVNLLAGWTKNPEYPVVAINAARTSEMIYTQPVVYEFSKLKMPVLLIIGQRDRTAIGKTLVSKEQASNMGNYPALGRKTKQSIPGSKLVELQHTGHLPHIENFKPFISALLSFLQ